jgi:hypothetical protein
MIQGHDLTAAQIGGTVSGDVDADGCDIGVYNPDAVTAGADIHGAKYYGVVVNRGKVDITGASVHNIGDSPFSGTQYGVGIYYTGGATGEISGNTVSQYQKGGIVAKGTGTTVSVKGNTVTGLGAVKFIAQNGIQISGGAGASEMTGNTVSKNQYTGGGWTATGILFYQADPVTTPKAGKIASQNKSFNNQANVAVVK